ncbi:MAG: GntR family transcriptional regulator [Victivallales bacterium]|nr:GntR family transcriptional regulator [Victivallales bacterium]
MRGRPSIVEKVKQDLWRIVRQARLAHDVILPGERELAGQLHVSRCTLRKVLDEFEEERVISRTNQMTRLLPEKCLKGRYAFIAAGNCIGDRFLFGLYRRLWEELCLHRDCLDIDLLFVPHLKSVRAETWVKRLRQYDVVFASYVQTSLFRSLLDAGLPMVALDEQDAVAGCPLISLDNRRIGSRAAEILLEAGCRRALDIEFRTGSAYEPFRFRHDGFQQTFTAGGGCVSSISNPHETDNPLHCLNVLSEMMEPFLNDGTDAVFFLSNECVPLLGWFWYQYHRIPQEVKLLAFRGSAGLDPQFVDMDYLEMDYAGTVAAMLDVARRFAEQGVLPSLGKQYIPPIYCSGGTVHKEAL